MEPLTLQRVDVRPVVVPLKRPVISKVGVFHDWPLILIDLYTHQGVVGVLAEPFIVTNGHLNIPHRPGCGIDWNEQAVTRFRYDG